MKIHLTAIIKSKPEHQAEVLEVLQNMVKETRKEEACELYSLHQVIENKNEFVFYEIWKSKEGLDQHNQQPYIQAFGALVEEKLQEKPQIYITNLI
ncbi:antibiotic biosynthesis monooxygenase [Chryseobacterium cucumeris]|uniref:Antibiotic biosynthesis monooxygenase n=1 Tax=Chryseobacterium cucumeris TaxID=1813611 RepID=A0ABX9X4R9_9FLAO|nr:putative quinol monooxygenase [Chryseobacterium cucumeris]ROH91303.1 antibiotic biosynthesis monooxygenase [Chryseobacterium cucumeris]